jgi:hypothetical protein
VGAERGALTSRGGILWVYRRPCQYIKADGSRLPHLRAHEGVEFACPPCPTSPFLLLGLVEVRASADTPPSDSRLHAKRVHQPRSTWLCPARDRWSVLVILPSATSTSKSTAKHRALQPSSQLKAFQSETASSNHIVTRRCGVVKCRCITGDRASCNRAHYARDDAKAVAGPATSVANAWRLSTIAHHSFQTSAQIASTVHRAVLPCPLHRRSSRSSTTG